MFETLLTSIVGMPSMEAERPEGAAFLKVAKDLYGLDCLAYLAVNIPAASPVPRYAHCSYSDADVRHCLTRSQAASDPLSDLSLLDGVREWEAGEWPKLGLQPTAPTGPERVVTFPLPSRLGEYALFGLIAAIKDSAFDHVLRELRILGDYFHSHILRINGHNADAQILVSARELDCLKWTAAGKTAWEASVILGISERTVRFHLNAAREKLDCATTTQAVAKAITQHLIDV
jgi:DNA-binding CsgD family transcriptional regulator